LVYRLDRTLCDGLNQEVVTSTKCTLPLSSLIADPYNLRLGHEIYAKVRAINDYGESVLSDGGNGATVRLVPDAPLNL